MAKQFIHEIGDKLSVGATAENLPKHIKEIAPIMFNDGNNNYNSIQAKLNEKAPLASPEFTGTPKAPTAAVGTNTTQIATTAFVKQAVDNAQDIKVKATEKTDSNHYKILAASTPSHRGRLRRGHRNRTFNEHNYSQHIRQRGHLGQVHGHPEV